MRHHYLSDEDTSGDHYAVGDNQNGVLVQLGVNGEQLRLLLRPDQALHMIELLQISVGKLKD